MSDIILNNLKKLIGSEFDYLNINCCFNTLEDVAVFISKYENQNKYDSYYETEKNIYTIYTDENNIITDIYKSLC